MTVGWQTGKMAAGIMGGNGGNWGETGGTGWNGNCWWQILGRERAMGNFGRTACTHTVHSHIHACSCLCPHRRPPEASALSPACSRCPGFVPPQHVQVLPGGTSAAHVCARLHGSCVQRRACVCTGVHKFLCAHVWHCMCACRNTRVCECTRVCAHPCVHVCEYTCVHVSSCVCPRASVHV